MAKGYNKQQNACENCTFLSQNVRVDENCENYFLCMRTFRKIIEIKKDSCEKFINEKDAYTTESVDFMVY